MQTYYSLAEIANKLDIPDSTVRKYAKVYEEFLPSHEREGERWPVYEEEALAIIQEISELSKNGSRRHEIKEQLQSKYTTTINADNTPTAPAQQHDHNTPTLTRLRHDNSLAAYMGEMTIQAFEAAEMAKKNIDFWKMIATETREEADQWKERAETAAKENDGLREDNELKQERIDELEQELKNRKKPWISFGSSNEEQ